jgi:hypothetical protein
MAQCDVGLVSCDLECAPFECAGVAAAGARRLTAGAGESAAATTGLVVLPENPAPGTTFIGEVTIDVGETPLGAYSIELSCDAAALELVPPVAGGTTSEFAAAPTQNIEGCGVSLAAYQASRLDGPTGTVSVARVTFRVRPTVETSTTVRLEVKSLFATDGQAIVGQGTDVPIRIVPIGATFTPVPPHPTPTGTDTLPPSTATPTPTVSLCTGDCDGDESVVVNEIITLVNVALGNAQPPACPHGIPDGATVNVALIIQAVNHALNSCPTS